MTDKAIKIVEAHDDKTIDAITSATSTFENYVKDLKRESGAGKLVLFGAYDGISYVGRCVLKLVPDEEKVRQLVPGQPVLVALEVVKDARGKGIGTALCTAVLQKAKALGYEKISLGVEEDNVLARNLYEKIGFTYAGTTYEACWDEPDGTDTMKRVCVEAVLMVKVL